MNKYCRFFKLISFIFLLCFFSGSLSALSIEESFGTLSQIFSGYQSNDAGLTVFRSLAIPSGGKAESLGTAFTALCNDAGYFEYNPAGSSVLDNTELALYHNAWIADSALETVSFATRIRNLGLGASVRSFYVPFTQYDGLGEELSTGYYSESFAMLNASYNFFTSYKFKGVSFGATLKAGYRSVPNFIDSYIKESIPVSEKVSGSTQSAFAFLGDFGVLYRTNVNNYFTSRIPNFRMAFALTNLGFVLPKDDAKESVSSTLALGLSWQFSEKCTVMGEVRESLNLTDFSAVGLPAVAFGTEMRLANNFALDLGFLLKGANPKFSFGAQIDINLFSLNFNYSLDLATSFHPINRISLSIRSKLGDGGRAEDRSLADSYYIRGLEQYLDGNYTEAISSWRKVLLIDSDYQSASRAIDLAKKLLIIEDYIETIDETAVF